MSTNIFRLTALCLAFISCEQPKIKFDKIIDFDSARLVLYTELGDPPPIDPDLSIDNTQFVEALMKNVANVDSLAQGNTLTKTLFLNVLEPGDSVLILQNDLDNYRFAADGTGWQIRSFEIRSASPVLSPLSIGLPSEEVFRLLNSQVNKRVGERQIWVSQEGTNGTRIILSFSDDKLRSILF